MKSGSVERLHHFWVFTSVINDLSCIEIIDARLGRRDQEESTRAKRLPRCSSTAWGFPIDPGRSPAVFCQQNIVWDTVHKTCHFSLLIPA
jgi:hypothetical protein